MLNNNGDDEHSCQVLNLRESVFGLSSPIMILAIGFSHCFSFSDDLYQVKTVPSFPSLRIFIMNDFFICSNAFAYDQGFFFFLLLDYQYGELVDS